MRRKDDENDCDGRGYVKKTDTNLHIHRRLLPAADSPFAVDDGERNASDALLAGLSNLGLNLCQELVGLQKVECLQCDR